MNYKAIYISLLTGFLLLSAGQISGREYYYTSFDIDDGLDQSYIYSISQGRDGFLWLGTENGLIRYDGIRFDIYTVMDSLAENFVTSSMLSSRGELWIGHNQGSLTIRSGSTFRKFPIPGNMNRINTIFEDRDKNIWLGTQGGGLIRIHNKKSIKIFTDDYLGSLIYSVNQDKNGNILVGTSDGLFKYTFKRQDQSMELIKVVPEFEDITIKSIIRKRYSRRFWIGTEHDGLYEYQPASLFEETEVIENCNGKLGRDIKNIHYLYQDKQSNLWISTYGHGVLQVRLRANNYYAISVPVSKDDENDYIKCIFEDREGNVWLGSYGGGLIQLKRQTFDFYGMEHGLLDNNVNCISQDQNGYYWFGTSGGISVISRDHFPEVLMTYTKADGIPSNEISALYEDMNGTFWVGTRRSGLCKINPKTGEIRIVSLNQNRLSKHINYITGDEKGDIWIATVEGLYRYSLGSRMVKYYSTLNGLIHNNVQAIYVDTEGRLWLASQGFGIMYFDGKQFHINQPGNISTVTMVNSITEDEDHNIWFGTQGQGLYKYNGKDFYNYTTMQGLQSDYTYAIQVDDDNNLWISHKKGISRFDHVNELFYFYNEKEGFLGGQTNINAKFKDQDGALWFGTVNGAAKVAKRSKDQDIILPNVHITGLRLFNEPHEIIPDLELPFKQYNITFEYVGICLKDPEKVRYQYMLEGFDIDWSDVVSANKVTYSKISEGEYTFKVRACNSEGMWNEEASSYSFVVATPFWKTTWFPVAVVLSLIGGVFLTMRFRTEKLEQQRQYLRNEVKKRTRELAEKNIELEKRTNEISLLFESMPVITYMTAADKNYENLRFTYVSSSIRKHTKYKPEDLVNNFNFWESRIHEDDISTVTTKLFKLYTKGDTEFDFRWQVAPNDYRWFRNISRVIKFDDGTIRQVGLWHDISAHKASEEAIIKMNESLENRVRERTQQLETSNKKLQDEIQGHVKTTERLKEINKELDTFVYKATHDLRGPLSSTLGLVNLMKSEIKDEEALNYVDMISESTQRLDTILLELLEVSTIKHSSLKFSQIKFNKLIPEIYKSLNNKADTDEISFDLKIKEDDSYYSDKTILTSIFQNLLDNAIKYRRTKGKNPPSIKVTVKTNESGVDIEVQDNGCGIQDAAKDKVFDMFFRGDLYSKGSGLGLYIVKTSVNKLGGNIDFESSKNKGTTFRVFIPNKRDQKEAA